MGKSKEEQSKSIKNQIDICQKYISDERMRFPGCQFEIISILKDDGISGTTFDRHDFKELVNLVEEKRANMVITTDLSRLGRDHVKTDDYIEEWFPKHNVRYVSIIEGIDTYTDSVSNDIAPIINWSNEHFAKLTSKKIKGRFNLLRGEGKWTGGEPPLGYKIDPSRKYKFIIDYDGAEVVKRIFNLFLSTKSCTEVAKILSNEKVPIPTVLKGTKRTVRKDLIDVWSPKTIKTILTNETYLGSIIQGKTTRLNHKSNKTIYLPRDGWIKIPNMHEPIIDEGTFNLVQNMFRSNRNKTGNSRDYLLRGLLKCRECGHTVGIQHFKDRSVNYTVCNYYKKYGSIKKVCSAHRFKYEDIESIVLKRIKEDCFSNIDISHLIKDLYANLKKRSYDKNVSSAANQRTHMENIAKLKKEIDMIYEDRLKGIIDLEQYKKMVYLKRTAIELEKSRCEELKAEVHYKAESTNYKKLIEDLLDKPNKIFIFSLIDKILIGEDGSLDIYYKIQKPTKKV